MAATRPTGNSQAARIQREIQALAEGVYRQRIRDIDDAEGKPFGIGNGVRELTYPHVGRMVVEEAFNIMSRASQTSNRKLRDIAQGIVDKAQGDPSSGGGPG